MAIEHGQEIRIAQQSAQMKKVPFIAVQDIDLIGS